MESRPEIFARVVIPSPVKQPLMYRVPPALQDQLSVGMRVLVPLAKRKVTGIVLELLAESPVAQTKEIATILDERPILDALLIKLSQWIARYYLAGIGEVLAVVLPPSLRSASRRTVVAKPGTFAIDDPVANRILDLLRQKKGKVGIKVLAREMAGRNIQPSLERLESFGAIEIRDSLPGHRERSPGIAPGTVSTAKDFPTCFTLSLEQEHALHAIHGRLDQGGFETFLLHGVTGSGKTEVYLRAMERVRASGRRSLILIPEISLTPQLIDRLNARFPGKVGVLHSALTPAERWAYWWQIVRGAVDVIVGARSAVFAPVSDLGLIVVDEEHDPSYKQDEGVRYNGRDIAVVRGKLSQCAVILGSATPAIESYENCLQGRYRLLEITKRVYERPLPKIETVDLRFKLKGPVADPADITSRLKTDKSPKDNNSANGLISQRLIEALQRNYQKAWQSLIFLNRRGFSNFLQCTLCGYVVRCQYCSVTLTLHLKQNRLCCHHCNFRKPVSDICPSCGNSTLSGVGAGTEQTEDTLRHLVPGARIARMDRDTTSQRGSHERLIRQWEKGEIDILIGTQMITKGHDVIGVTLVGALLADLSLNLPDFRAAERTFQLLSQVAGRSGRGDDPGRVIIQTYNPDHYAIKYLIDHDYKSFVQSELEFRRALHYPPFTRLICVRIDGPKSEEVETKAKAVAVALREKAASKSKLHEAVEILGPAPAPIYKLRNRYRWQILLKGKQISSLLKLASQAEDFAPRARNLRLHIDVDPYNML
jgi:primosomal protein N' (replication factor Y)